MEKWSYKNKSKISAPTWNDKFELPDGSCSVSDILSHQRHGEKRDNPPVTVYVNTIETRITFRIKTGYYLELLIPESMKLFGSLKSKITNAEIGEYVAHLKIAEVA